MPAIQIQNQSCNSPKNTLQCWMTEPTLSRERRVHCMDTRGGLVPDSRCPQFFTLTPLGALKSVKRHITDSTHPLCWSSLGLMPQCNNNAITPAVQILHPPVSQQSLRIYYSIKLILSMQMQEASVISHNSRKSLSPRNNYQSMFGYLWQWHIFGKFWCQWGFAYGVTGVDPTTLVQCQKTTAP